MRKTKDERFNIVETTRAVGGDIFSKEKLVHHLEDRDSLNKIMRKKWLNSTIELSKLSKETVKT